MYRENEIDLNSNNKYCEIQSFLRRSVVELCQKLLEVTVVDARPLQVSKVACFLYGLQCGVLTQLPVVNLKITKSECGASTS